MLEAPAPVAGLDDLAMMVDRGTLVERVHQRNSRRPPTLARLFHEVAGLVDWG